MPTAQTSIFAEGSSHHHYLEFTVSRETDIAALRAALRDAIAAHQASGKCHLVVAFGPDVWSRLGRVDVPLGNFRRIDGIDGYAAPSTQRDLFFWMHGAALDDNLDAALAIQRSLAPVAALALDERGFTYHDLRDLTGFVDGTANPKEDERYTAALIPDDEPGAGGAFVLSQRWNHDLEKFATLPVAEQERVIGRTKPDSIELEGDAMPDDSHVSRTDVKEDGVGLKIYRRSAPFGTVGVHGLYFLAFACSQRRFQVQLDRMFGVSGDGLHDRLIEFSTPDSGSYWFAPSEEDLAAALSG